MWYLDVFVSDDENDVNYQFPVNSYSEPQIETIIKYIYDIFTLNTGIKWVAIYNENMQKPRKISSFEDLKKWLMYI